MNTQLPKEIVDKIQHEAEEYAFSRYPQSVKEYFEATYWTLHNVAILGYKSAALHYSQIMEEKDKQYANLKQCAHDYAEQGRKEMERVDKFLKEIEGLKAENERLKGLIKKMDISGFPSNEIDSKTLNSK